MPAIQHEIIKIDVQITTNVIYFNIVSNFMKNLTSGYELRILYLDIIIYRYQYKIVTPYFYDTKCSKAKLLNEAIKCIFSAMEFACAFNIHI